MVEVLHKHEIPVGVASDDGLFGWWSEAITLSRVFHSNEGIALRRMASSNGLFASM